jgi:phage baseplate assembly protein W
MARLTRAEVLTKSESEIEYFSDFATSFAKTPFGDQLVKVKNEKSINQSLRNLISTNLGERPFQPFIGSNVLDTLFENVFEEDFHTLEFYIENVIRNYEQRVNLLSVEVSYTDTSEQDITVSINYNTINNPEPITFNYILKRVR